MRLLFIHSKPFSFKATEPTRFAEPIGPTVKAEGSAEDALVVMLATEKPDEQSPDRVVAKAALEVEKAFKNLGAKTIVLYPYAHLSNNLCAPEIGLAIIKKMREALAHHPLIACPFGWYKAFQLNGVGHPVSELSRVIEVEQSEITRSMDRGREHPVNKLCQTFREVMLDLGLDEMINPAIVEDFHIYKQYGPEAPLILDRVFYIAGLDRADIGLSKAKEQKLLELMPGFNRLDDLQSLLRQYKEAAIEADDFLEEMALQLRISGDLAGEIIEKVFPEFRELKPVPTNKTLRSHMTSNWFPVLQRVRHKMPLPIRLFSVGSRFRREQRQDAHHLFESTSASIVVMAKNQTLDDGKRLTVDVLKRVGFSKCTFKKKKIASRYYDPETDTEVFVRYQGQDIEVGNLGFYAPKALANYDIDMPVFNIGYGVERIAMMLAGGDDIRAVVYPQMYEEVSFDDAELAKLLKPRMEPVDAELKRAAKSMSLLAAEKRHELGPAEVKLYAGPIAGRSATITLFNWDEDKPIISLAAMNEVYVYQGHVYGLPQDRSALGDKYVDIYKEGINTGLRFIDLIIMGFAAEIEKRAAAGGPGTYEEKLKITKRPFQINLEIPEAGYDYIQRTHKTIRVGGPLFFGLRGEWD